MFPVTRNLPADELGRLIINKFSADEEERFDLLKLYLMKLSIYYKKLRGLKNKFILQRVLAILNLKCQVKGWERVRVEKDSIRNGKKIGSCFVIVFICIDWR